MNSTRCEALARDFVELLMRTVPEAAARLEWSVEEVHEFRRRALADTLDFALARSSWHRRRLEGVDIEALDPDDLSRLPTMTKADLMAHWDEIVTDPRLDLETAKAHMHEVDATGPTLLLDEYQVFATGGSTGEPGIFCWSRDESARWISGVSRWIMAAGRKPAERTAWVAARSLRHPSAAIPTLLDAAGLPNAVIPIDQPVDEIVDRLNEYQPDALWVVSSMLPALTAAAQHGRLQIEISQLSVGSDILEPAAADAAEEVFGVRPIEGYPTTDVGHVAQQVPGETGLSVNDDLLIVEAVDENDEAVSPGTTSHHLLVTSLHQRTLPLIRYRIDDRVTMEPEPGRYPAFRRVAAIEGRSDDLFTYGDHQIHPHTFRSVMARHPEIEDYEVRQVTDGVHVALVAEGLGPPDLRDEIAAALDRAGLAGAEVSVTVVDALPRTFVGKRRRFVPLTETRRETRDPIER